jgi:hypothetical protein
VAECEIASILNACASNPGEALLSEKSLPRNLVALRCSSCAPAQKKLDASDGVPYKYD